MTFEARHLSQAIMRNFADVVSFTGNPANLPRWATGLSAGIRHEGGRWITDSPMGPVEVRFRDGVELGILDHDVVFPDGTSVHNPLRVLHNDSGSEIVFTLYRLPDTTEDAYERDAALVRDDLVRLRDILEAGD